MVDALTGYTRPAAGQITFDGRDISRLRPYRRARLGLARTFQSVELFGDLTVDENLLVASEHVTVASAIRDLVLPHRPPDRTGSASWSASAGPWPASPGWSCSTSPRPGWTPTRASNWGGGCAPCPKSTA